jgi:hypothetical protein
MFRLNYLFLISFSIQIHDSFPFAAWFVERSSSCYINVRDSSEVVMNNFIIPFEQTLHPEIFIEIYDSSNRIVHPGIINGKKTIFQDEKSETYTLKLNTAGVDVQDLQYIMDVKIDPELDDDQIQKLNGKEDRFQAKFLSPVKGCHDYRASGRNRDKGLKLNVVLPPSVYDSSKSLDEHSIDIVAAWACGHEAITLTESIRVLPKRGSDEIGRSNNGDTAKNMKIDIEEEAKATLNPPKYTANSYLTAFVVFIIVGGTLINACLAMSKPRANKGKRKL